MMLNPPEIGVIALANSALCLAVTVATTIALRGGELKKQLRALRALTAYVASTLLLNVYLLSVAGDGLTGVSLALSAASVASLWAAVYGLWAKGE